MLARSLRFRCRLSSLDAISRAGPFLTEKYESRRDHSSANPDVDGLGKPVEIFDRLLKQAQRNRAASLINENDPLLFEVTDCLIDRLQDCKRTFPVGAAVGGAVENVRRQLRNRGGIEKLFVMDISPSMVDRSRRNVLAEKDSKDGRLNVLPIVGDEEFLPFRPGSLDLIISSLGLHWVNDLHGALTQCRKALKPDGLFLGAMFGGETIKELRISCTIAQQEREGGVSPRVSPLAQVRDAGSLLTEAGFAMPAVDVDEITVRYPSALELIEHLRSMGESNAVLNRPLSLSRDTAMATAAIYQSLFELEDGTVPATFQVIYMAGWCPHPSQSRAKCRGSASVSLKDLQAALQK